MPVRWLILAVMVFFGASSHALAADAPPTMHGVNYLTWGYHHEFLSENSDRALAGLPALGVDWVSLRVVWLQEAFNSRTLHPGYVTQSDEALAHAVKRCHALGIKAMLTLVVDFADPMRGGSYRWRGQINPGAPDPVPPPPADAKAGSGASPAAAKPPAPAVPPDPKAWADWFTSYEGFVLHYAALCERAGADGLCIGCELTSAATRSDQPWRQIIRKARALYKGKLTYQANWSPLQYAFAGLGAAGLLKDKKWNAEYRAVRFWDALDCASLSTYFSLSDKPDPPSDELDANLSIWRDELRDWQRSIGKPVVFGEVGYQSADRSAVEPWRTPLKTRANPQLQARCYEAFFKAFSGEPWVGGMFLWFACPLGEWGVDDGGMGYPFTGKPAEETVRKWYHPRKS